MPSHTPKPETDTASETKAPGTCPPAKDARTRVTMEVPLAAIARDPQNRTIDEDGESFATLVDSIAIFGVLQHLHVRQQGQGYELLDGERRWRAAQRAGLTKVRCEVWPATATRPDIIAAGIVLNVQRENHSLIQMARRLRELKNTEGLTIEEVARRVSLNPDRAKSYLALFDASDHLIQLCEQVDVPLKVAVELVRYERATSEAKSRALAKRYREEPISREEIIKLRRREAEKREGATSKDAETAPKRKRYWFVNAMARAYREEPAEMIEHLKKAVEEMGYHLAPGPAPAK